MLPARLSLLFLATAALLQGTGAAAGASAENGWEWGCIDTRELQRTEPENLTALIEKAHASFSAHPLDPSGDRLELAGSFEDRARDVVVIVFGTWLMTDTQVIYVFDGDEMIVERFASSTWQFLDPQSPESASYRAGCR